MPIESVNPPGPTPEAPKAPAAEPKPTFESVRAARHEAQGAPADKPVEKPGAKVEIEMTPEELAKATALSREAREARARVKELEARAGAGEKLEQAQKLAAEGKHLAAVELLGIDLNAAVAEQLGVAKEGGEVDPKVAELTKTVEELKAGEAERAKRDAAELAARTTAARAADVKVVAEHVKKDAAKYPYLARSEEWVREAYDGASDAYPKLKEDLGRELTGEEKNNLMLAALDEAEARHAERAKLYALERGSGAAPPRPGSGPTSFDPSMRGGTGAAAKRPQTRMTLAEAKRARRQVQ